MKVKELIEKLKDADQEMDVLVPAWHGHPGRGSRLVHCELVFADEDNCIPMKRSEDKITYIPIEPEEGKELYRKALLLHGDDERRRPKRRRNG